MWLMNICFVQVSLGKSLSSYQEVHISPSLRQNTWKMNVSLRLRSFTLFTSPQKWFKHHNHFSCTDNWHLDITFRFPAHCFLLLTWMKLHFIPTEEWKRTRKVSVSTHSLTGHEPKHSITFNCSVSLCARLVSPFTWEQMNPVDKRTENSPWCVKSAVRLRRAGVHTPSCTTSGDQNEARGDGTWGDQLDNINIQYSFLRYS